jgi:ankyrin repeat protein
MPSPLFDQLSEAVDREDLLNIRRLLAEGADPNETDANGYGPIHDWHNVEVYRLLVEVGAGVNTLSGGGTRALAECAQMGDIPGVTHLLSAGARPDLGNLPSCQGMALHMAVYSDEIEVVKLLLDAGADINLQDADCWTCLWWLKSPEMAAYLLSRGADPSIQGDNEDLPEDWIGHIPEPVRDILKQHRLTSAPRSTR